MLTISVFGVSNKSINFSTELIEKAIIYDLLLLIAIYSTKNDDEHTHEMRN